MDSTFSPFHTALTARWISVSMLPPYILTELHAFLHPEGKHVMPDIWWGLADECSLTESPGCYHDGILPRGIFILHLLCCVDAHMHCWVVICSVQVGLVDVARGCCLCPKMQDSTGLLWVLFCFLVIIFQLWDVVMMIRMANYLESVWKSGNGNKIIELLFSCF